jgi:hypothetical protein
MENVLTNQDGEPVITASQYSTKNDFDFLVGDWNIHNRKLISRLNNCQDWIEFEATQEMSKVLAGFGNIDFFHATIAGEPFEGLTLRLFDPQTRLWSIYWSDSNSGKLDRPVRGSFDDQTALFCTNDVFEGKSILMLFKWDATNPEKPVWSQAFSADGGTSWEWNWYMYFTRR